MSHAKRPWDLCLLATALVVGLASGSLHARAQDSSDTPSTSSRALGRPNEGTLEAPSRLRPAPHLVIQRSNTHQVFGVEELVGAVRRAAARVHDRAPGPPLLVGALSRRRGGRMAPHSSHQNGLDADLGLFLVDASGRAVEAPRFVELGRDGCGEDRGTRYCLDAGRTFELLLALLEDPVARVQWFLLAQDLRRRVLDGGQRRGASADQMHRVRLATEPHDGSQHHRNHVHMRLYCPVDDRPQCRDTPPYHDWYEGTPPRPRVSARVRRRRQARRRARRQRIRRRRARVRQRRAERRRRRTRGR